MLIKTLSVREAREQLTSVLDRFRKGDRTPVGVGSHRRTEAVMVPVDVYDEIVAARAESVAQATGSLRAEGLTASQRVREITDRWVRGEITSAQMHTMVGELYGLG